MSEVYIDGCNVAGCKYANGLYNGVYGCINLNLNPACSKNPNCYFKQLQRAKAEKQDLINYFELREGGMQEDIQYWKNKAQELYKELEQYKASKQASYEAMQAEWNKAVNELRTVKAENEKLKKALEKIREIAKLHQYFNPELLEIKGNIGQIQDLKMTEIYEKCKEVLGG